MAELTGPIGFGLIETAPRDGRFVRLRFRPGILMPAEHETLGQWQPHQEMAAGGWWFTPDGGYVSPGPLFWAPLECPEKRDVPCLLAWCCMMDDCLASKPHSAMTTAQRGDGG